MLQAVRQVQFERQLAVLMAILAFMGTLMLGMGQEIVSLPLMMFVAVVASLYFTDFKRIFFINNLVANLAALGAVILALSDFSQFERNMQLLAIANLLVYLQVIVLFQEKDVRIYWQLIMLSLLQVVVASALNFSMLFGALLVAYSFVGLLALVLFFVYREELHYTAARTASGGSERAAGTKKTIQISICSVRELALLLLQRGIVRPALVVTALTLLFTIFLFYSVPRVGQSSWQATAQTERRITGFTQTVELGALGEVSTSDELVMRVQFSDSRGTPIKLTAPPLLRGSIVTRYQSNQWSHDGSSGQIVKLLRIDPGREDVTRQDITLESLNEPVIFSVYPAFRYKDERRINLDESRNQLVRSLRLQHSTIQFDLATTGIKNNAQLEYTPYSDSDRNIPLRKLRELPGSVQGKDMLAGLKQTTQDVLDDAGIAAAEDPVRAAKKLELFLQREGGFTYSLGRRPPPTEAGIDPLEDFVMNNRTGHCEYYASALTLMLRSQNIPARMIIGFKGGEWNSLGQFYQMRQHDAHSWVEAYVSREHLSDRVKQNLPARARGAWLRLDPTTSQLAQPPGVIQSWLATANESIDYARLLWSTHVIGLDLKKQQEKIYTPIANFFKSIWSEIVALWQSLSQAVTNWVGGNWFSWRGGLVAMLVCCLLIGVIKLIQTTIRFLANRWKEYWVRKKNRRPEISVEFYRRLEKLLGRLGQYRPASQTQREFATVAGGEFAESPEYREVSPLPRQIVDAYYLVRFGTKPLDTDQQNAVEQSLQKLEEIVKSVAQSSKVQR